MNVSYEGIGQWAATFACDGVSAGQVVKVQRRQSLLCGYGGHGDGKLHRGFRACCWLELFGSGRQRRREGRFRWRQGLSCRGSGYHR